MYDMRERFINIKLNRPGGVKIKVEGLNHIFHIFIPHISLMIEKRSRGIAWDQ